MMSIHKGKIYNTTSLPVLSDSFRSCQCISWEMTTSKYYLLHTNELTVIATEFSDLGKAQGIPKLGKDKLSGHKILSQPIEQVAILAAKRGIVYFLKCVATAKLTTVQQIKHSRIFVLHRLVLKKTNTKLCRKVE